MRWVSAPGERLAAIALETARAAVDLRLRSGDERWQAIDADAVGNHRLWLGLRRLKLRLRAMLAGGVLVARLGGVGPAGGGVSGDQRVGDGRGGGGRPLEVAQAFAPRVGVRP